MLEQRRAHIALWTHKTGKLGANVSSGRRKALYLPWIAAAKSDSKPAGLVVGLHARCIHCCVEAIKRGITVSFVHHGFCVKQR